MTMPDRSFGNDNRYGFNGKERDKDIHSLTAYDYGFRIYNPALGKFLSVDPLSASFPWNSPYSYAEGDPVNFIDLDGLERAYKDSYTGAVTYIGDFPRSIPLKNGWNFYFDPTLLQNLKTNTTSAPITKPLITPGSDYLASVKAVQNKQVAVKQIKSLPKPNVGISQNVASISAGRPWTREDAKRSEAITASIEQSNRMAEVMNSDPVTRNSALSASVMVDVVQAPVRAIDNGIQNAKDGDWWGVAGNALQLGLSASPFIPVKGIGFTFPTRLARVIPEELAASTTTLGKAGSLDVFVVDASALKGLTTSEQIAQKLTMLNPNLTLKKGPFRIIEFDTPSVGLAQPFNRTTTGFINGGKTMGGATEYVIPNAPINSLNNVIQTTIK